MNWRCWLYEKSGGFNLGSHKWINVERHDEHHPFIYYDYECERCGMKERSVSLEMP